MSAAKVSKPAMVREMTAGQLADEHRGCSMGRWRYEKRIKEVEVELERRKLTSAQGAQAIVSLQIGDVGLVDLKRLRADLGPDICREYAIPGSDRFWRSTPIGG